MSTNQYSNVCLTVISGMAVVGLILFICKLIKKLPPINWVGTNSLVILCTHHLIYRPIGVLLMKLGTDNVLILFLFILSDNNHRSSCDIHHQSLVSCLSREVREGQ